MVRLEVWLFARGGQVWRGRDTRRKEIVSKLRQVDVLVSQGTKVPDAVRSIGVTDVTYYRWRREYGGLQMDQVKRSRPPESSQFHPLRLATVFLPPLLVRVRSPQDSPSFERRAAYDFGQAAPASAQALINAPNSFCVPGAGSRPLPGVQPQPTSESSAM